MIKKKSVKLIIFPGYFLPHIGGLETHIDELSKFLSKDSKFNITIFAPNIPNAKKREIIHKNVEVIRYPAFEIVSNYPFPKFWNYGFWKVFIKLYSREFNVVMTRTRFFSNTALGLFFAKFRLKRIKLIHGEHGSGFVKVESKFTNLVSFVYDKTMGKIVFLCADKIIAVSSVVEKFIKKDFVKNKKIAVIRRGIDFTKYEKIKPNKEILKKNKGKIIITTVTRLYKWKGVINLIKAFKSLPSTIRKKCVLIIGGYGEDFERIKKETSLFLDKEIFLTGELSFNEAAALMKASDIYVHSSYSGGGQSSSLLVGMYCKCAIVASPHEGAKETLQGNDCGILLKNNSPKEIARGINDLVKNKKLREKYANNSHNLLITKYNWRDVVEKYDKLISDILEK